MRGTVRKQPGEGKDYLRPGGGIRPLRAVKSLIVKHPWIDQIVDGSKTIEFRSFPTRIRGRIGLIASGEKGRIIGTVEISDCLLGADGIWNWKLRNPRRLDQPATFEQPLGCVTWVNGPEV